MTRAPSAEARARKVLETIARDPAAWDAMTSLLNARAIREGLVAARVASGLTQAQVAKRMGVKQPTVSEFETTRYPDPCFTTLQRYARAVNCQIDVGLLVPPPAVPADGAGETRAGR